MSVVRAPFALLVVAACGSGESPPPAPTPPVQLAADAGTADAEALQAGEGKPSTPARPTRPIEIVMRSSPVPARVYIDGKEEGVTPFVWQGTTGLHEFVFDAPGFGMQRYRYAPITNGVMHPRLERVADDIDAGVLPPPEVVPPQPPAPVTVDVDAQPAPIAPVDAPAAPIGPAP